MSSLRVALFPTCVNDAVHPATAIATVTVLERLGVEARHPQGPDPGSHPTHPTAMEALPSASWGRIVQLGRNLLLDLEDAGSETRFLILDRDSKFATAFNALPTPD